MHDVMIIGVAVLRVAVVAQRAPNADLVRLWLGLARMAPCAPIDAFCAGSGEHVLLIAAIECDVASLLSLARQAGSIR